jgi:branched-chain amino acid aminotransferase
MMQELQLYAVLEEGPVRIPLTRSHLGFETLYEGLDLGVYTAMRTFHHTGFLDLDHHLQRTRRSMARLRLDHELDERRMRRALHEVCSAWPGEDMRVRIDVLAATATALKVNTTELIALAPFTPPAPEKYERGVAVVSTRSVSRVDPLTKTADFAARRAKLMQRYPHAEECLLIGEDERVLEGASSNFYAVLDGVLHTAGEGVLEGVTRAIVLELAARDGLAVRLQAPEAQRLAEISEAAISSSSRGLMPVVEIDGRPVGDGRPGPLVSGLWQRYQEHVRERVRNALGEPLDC